AALRTIDSSPTRRSSDLFYRDDLSPGMRLLGPAVVCDANGTTIVEPEWQLEILGGGEILLTRAVPKAGRRAIGTEADPVMLEILDRKSTRLNSSHVKISY